MDYDGAMNDGPSLEGFLAQLNGKTIANATVDDSGMDPWIVLTFTDGTSARIRYDWIYEAKYLAKGS